MNQLTLHYANVMHKIYRKLTALTMLLAVLSILALPFNADADDTSIYTGLDSNICQDTESYRFIFIVDNSGSITTNEFTTIKSTIDDTAETVLSSGLDGVELAVMQYGTNHDTGEHGYHITVPFTNNLLTATSWGRHYGTGTSLNRWFQDHLPGSLAEARIDDVYAAGNSLDITDGSNVQFVFFTDAWRTTGDGCCSMMVAEDGDAFKGSALPLFGEYDALKSGQLLTNSAGVEIKGQFTVLNVDPQKNSIMASAAIASVGGAYTGDIEANIDDPDGSQTKPRRLISTSFDDPELAQKITSLVGEVIEEIRSTNFTQTAPAVTVNAFNRLVNRTELFYSLFSPTTSPRWNGNIKGFTIRAEDQKLLDSLGNVAVDAASGEIKDTSVSLWSKANYPECDLTKFDADSILRNCSPTSDGAQAGVGAFRDNLTDSRKIYTQQRALESQTANIIKGDYFGGGIIQIKGDTEIEATLLGLDDSQNTIGSEDRFDEVTLPFNPVGGNSFTYSEAADSLIFNDSASASTTGWTAHAATPYFQQSGADLDKEHRFEFTFGENDPTLAATGNDYIIVGIQDDGDNTANSTSSITLGLYFTPNYKLNLYIPFGSSAGVYTAGTYADGDVFEFVISGDSPTHKILQNGVGIASYSQLQARNGTFLPAGTDFRGRAFGYESPDFGNAEDVIFQNIKLTQEDVGEVIPSTDTGREQVLKWIAGENVFNDNLSEATGDGNQFIADSLHTQPRVITYGGTANSPIDVLFHTTNMGALHAINPETGAEHWAYIPPELLANPLAYIRDNDLSTSHRYGLDGEMSTWVVRPPATNDQIEAGEATVPKRVFIYTGQRRGGKGIYAFNATNATSSNPTGANTCNVIGDGAISDPVCQLFRPIIGGTEANSTPGFEMLGQTWGKPTRLRVNTSDPSFCATGVDVCSRDVLMFVGGYDEQYDGVSQDCQNNEVGVASVSELAGCVVGSAIYMVDAFTGELVWKIGQQSAPTAGSVPPAVSPGLFVECNESTSASDSAIATDSPGTCNDDMKHSFVATPVSLDLDRDGAIDTIFANDISGQIWRIDLRSADTEKRVFSRVIDQVTAGVIADLSSTDMAAEDRFFYNSIDASILRDSPIATDEGTRINLVIGSGNRANPRNSSESTGNYFYVVYDTNLGTAPDDYNYVASPIAGAQRSQINLSTLEADSTQLSTYGFQVPTVDDEFEKVLSTTVTVAGVAIGVSYSPEISDQLCTIGGSRLYLIDLNDGSVTTQILAQPGIVSEAVVLNLLTDPTDDAENPQTPEIRTKVCVGNECFDLEDDLGIDPSDSNLGKAIKQAWWEVR